MRSVLRYDWGRELLHVADEGMCQFLKRIYRETRYLEEAPDDALKLRLHGLIAHIVEIYSNGEPSFETPNSEEGIAFIDLLAEMEIRKWNVAQHIKEELQRYKCAIEPSCIPSISATLAKLKGKKCLFKFTQSEHVHSIVNGEVRFKSAESYNRDGFNIAIRDDELNIAHQVKGLTIRLQDESSAPVIGNKISAHAAGDFYVSCYSVGFDLKLFPALGYDSCVVVTNADQFVERVKKECEKFLPDYQTLFGPVEYIDIHRRFASKKPIEFRKPSSFSFEKEWRFAAYPKHEQYPALAKEVQTLRLGLDDVETLVINTSN